MRFQSIHEYIQYLSELTVVQEAIILHFVLCLCSFASFLSPSLICQEPLKQTQINSCDYTLPYTIQTLTVSTSGHGLRNSRQNFNGSHPAQIQYRRNIFIFAKVANVYTYRCRVDRSKVFCVQIRSIFGNVLQTSFIKSKGILSDQHLLQKNKKECVEIVRVWRFGYVKRNEFQIIFQLMKSL